MTDASATRTMGLHPWSFVFLLGGVTRQVAVPLMGLVLVGGQLSRIRLMAGAVLCLLTVWSVLKARAYRYRLEGDTLHIQEGLVGRSQRHIPVARIQHISQRRKLLHRLLGVTELHLESASGSKPEAIMRVLGLRQAVALEALLRARSDAVRPTVADHGQEGSAEQCAATASAPHAPARGLRLLFAMDWPEVLRYGIASNRGMVIVAIALGATFQNEFLRKHATRHIGEVSRWFSGWVHSELQSSHLVRLGLFIAAGWLVFWCLTRLLSLALAVFRYHGFRLEREGDKLVAAHGLSTRVRAGARLKRLQSWQIDESWLHRRMARCRLSVTVAGGAGQADGGAHGLSPGLQMTELAPIGSWQQARDLLNVCVPTLHWETLAWQPLHKAWQGRLWSQGRWLVPALMVGVWLAKEGVLNLEVASAASLAALTLFAWVAYTRAWADFAAYALSGTVVLYRSGVWHRRWVIVETRRLHVLRLHSSMLDRQLGVVCFQASAQGGSRGHRTLEIPFMPRAIAEHLRAKVWHEFAALGRG